MITNIDCCISPTKVTWGLDIIADHDCNGATDPDMALSRSLGLDNTMATGGREGY